MATSKRRTKAATGARTADPVIASSIDPASPAIVLAYQGGRLGRFVPGRDLCGGDLARIVYRRKALLEQSSRSTIVRPGQKPIPPRRPDPATAADVTALAAELIASGTFAAVTHTDPIQPAPPAQPEA